MRAYSYLLGIIILVLLKRLAVDGVCVHEDDVDKDVDLCIKVKDLEKTSPEKKTVYVMQTPGNFEWDVLNKKYPNLSVSSIIIL